MAEYALCLIVGFILHGLVVDHLIGTSHDYRQILKAQIEREEAVAHDRQRGGA
jgi:hypothetical protein